MSKTKIIQYIHRPNTTELGMGNTHETYMLINSDINLRAIFPVGVDVFVEDTDTHKKYSLKSADGREFRVNQMGEIYRNHHVLPGDEIIITNVSKAGSANTYITVKQFNRVVLMVGNNGAEIINKERIDAYLKTSNIYEISTFDRGVQNRLKISFKGSKKKRSDSPNTTDFYSVSLNDIDLTNGTYYLTIGEKSTIVTLVKSNYNEIEFDDRLISEVIPQKNSSAVPSDLSPSIISYLTAIRTKPFLLLAGISGTGKSRIVRKLAQATDSIDTFTNDEERWKLHSPANFELIQVRPNWHNSMDVVGFKSNVGKEGAHYEFTPFVDFIIRAWRHLDVPFFLCLDEMNLAPVEEYFAEFLSAIESRSFDENGDYMTDPIIKPFDSFGAEVSGKMCSHVMNLYDGENDLDLENHFRVKGLTLPPNLIVMGTVNMDETTFSFSRKVLDRAMSIEMNEVNYDDFLNGKTEEDVPNLVPYNELLVRRPIKSAEVASEVDASTIMDYLKEVNEILEGTPYKLGYRAANEALLFVAAAKMFNNDNLPAALDDFTLMKVLSRIEGDDTKLKVANKQNLDNPELGDDIFPHLENGL